MTQIIEIENDLVRIVNREVIQQANLADVLPHIENRPALSLFHPRSVIFTHWDESNPAQRKVKFLCELDPGIRSIVKSNRRYRLAIPYTYFIFDFAMTGTGNPLAGEHWSFTNYRVFHARDRVRDQNSRLWTAFLPNVYEDGTICFGTTGVDTYIPLMDRVDRLVDEWYRTQFNNDVHGSRHHPLPFNGRLPNGWALWVNATNEHGLAAYQRFPEWDITDGSDGVSSWTVQELLTGTAPAPYAGRTVPIPGDRIRVAAVRDEIPAVEMPWTFGRTEEWFASLDPVQRFRIQTAANNYVEAHPDAVQAPAPVEPAEGEPTEDGGEPV